MQTADHRELDPTALAALRLAAAANDAHAPEHDRPAPAPAPAPLAAIGWDPAEVWRTRIRDARRGSDDAHLG